MKHGEFKIGKSFWCDDREWRCTDIGTRTIVGICLDGVETGGTDPVRHRMLGRREAETEGWFNGPPYAVPERIFDEDDLGICSSEPKRNSRSE